MRMQKRSAMAVRASTLLAVLVVIASQFRPSNARVSVPHRPVKQPIRLDLNLNERSSEESVGSLAETFKREMTRERRQVWDSSGGLDMSFADIDVISSTLDNVTADNHTSALLYWSGQVVFILFKGFKNDSGVSTVNHSWSLFRSMDSGASFSNVTDLLPPTAVLDNIWPSPNTSIILFSDQVNKKIYQAANQNFVCTQLDFSPDVLSFQSSELEDAEMYGKYILGYDKKERSLWVTTNITSWTRMGDNVTSFYWRELNSSIEDPSTVYFDQKVNITASRLYVANKTTTYDHPQVLFPELGAVVPNTFSLSHQYMFVQKLSDSSPSLQQTNGSSLWVSFLRKSFVPAKFPVDDSGKHFAVVDASEGRVMLIMYSPNTSSSALFQSDKFGISYTLSLVNVTLASPGIAGDDPVFDVYKVKGLPATYLANRKLPGDNFNYTYITFNSGGRWQTVNPPVIDSQRNPVECDSPCSLHLHLLANLNEFSQVLSVESAPGFIMALGNTGTHLDHNASMTRLYVSHDGGAHWEESPVDNGYGYFQVLDYGVYTLYAKQRLGHLSSGILASCDQGRNWSAIHVLPSLSLRVSGIAVDPKATTSQSALIYGYVTGSGQNSLGVIALDFEGNMTPACEEDDYRLWTQSSTKGFQSCVLGQRQVYKRRNLETCCYINDDYDYAVNHTLCLCGEEDYECNIGFFRKDQYGDCDPLPGTEYPPLPPAYCPEGHNYSYSNGYRKIAGDHCLGRNSSFEDEIVRPCPVVAPDGLHILIPSQNISTFPVQSTINFTLLQTQGSQQSTFYEWNFGDNGTEEATGFANANSTSHSYDRPNTYVVVVVASNDAGKSVAYKEINVLDIVHNVTVIGSSLVAVGTQVAFCVSVQTELKTQKYTPVHYKWMVNGKLVPNQNSTCYKRKFLQQTIANVSVSVTNALGAYNDTLCVEVAKVPAIGVSATSRIKTFSLGDHIPANTNVSFSVLPFNSNQTFPSDMVFHWVFFNESDTPFKHVVQNSDSYLTVDIQFDAGDYTVVVTGNSSIGSTSSSTPVSVMETIDRIHVERLQPGYRQFTNISAIVSVFTKGGNNSGYSGDVQIELQEERNRTHDLLYSAKHSVGRNYSSVSLDYPMTIPGVYTLTFVGRNDLPSFASKDQDVFVAGADQYEHFVLIFNVGDLVENYTDNRWMVLLQANITGELVDTLGVERWQLEVTLNEDDVSVNETYQFSRNVLEAHVYILPANLSDECISDLQNMTSQFLDAANNGGIAFYVNESEVLLSSAKSGVDLTCQLCFKPSSSYSSTMVVMTSAPMTTVISTPIAIVESTPMTTAEPTSMKTAEATLMTTAEPTPVATAEPSESNGPAVLVGLMVGLVCLLFNVIQFAVIVGMCCTRHPIRRRPRFSKGYLQMGKVERPVEGTFAVKNESLEEQDVEEEEDDNMGDNRDEIEDQKEDDDDDDNEDDSREDEKAAFITEKPPPDEESNM